MLKQICMAGVLVLSFGGAAPAVEPGLQAEEAVAQDGFMAGSVTLAEDGSVACTSAGGGTWGPVLRLCGSIDGNRAHFTVTKTSGSFTSSGTAHLTVGSPTGPDHDSTRYDKGVDAVVLSDDLSAWIGTYPKQYYVRVDADVGGNAWVGPITIEQVSQ